MTPPEFWSALDTSGHTNGAPSSPSTTRCRFASRTVTPSSTIRMFPVALTLPSSRVNQMDDTSPGPRSSASTQPGPSVRRQE
ncbi:hypothetical protein [Actinophytocola sp.]|uniref:hypothetical protein n=1 Tax=Actinophytocola sp. TaxID=1872138 RepID=UPI003D6C2908